MTFTQSMGLSLSKSRLCILKTAKYIETRAEELSVLPAGSVLNKPNKISSSF